MVGLTTAPDDGGVRRDVALTGDVARGVGRRRLVAGVEGDAARYAQEFLETLTRNLPRDLGAGFTTIGPHREDFKVRFKDADISAVASRGEVRTVVLAMKLAELGYAEDLAHRAASAIINAKLYRESQESDQHNFISYRRSTYWGFAIPECQCLQQS